jgi:FkbM family methyltransferase
VPVVEAARSVATFVWRHPANRDRRVRALLRAGSFQLRGRVLRRPVVARLGNASRLWCELHVTASSKVAYANPPDWNEMMAWRRLLGPGDLFVDGGANIGPYTVWAAELGARVIAVEPDAAAVARLRRNISLNARPVELVTAALTAVPGPVRMTVGLGAANHLVPDGGTEVPGTTLDELLGGRTAAGVKLDLEGAERPAIEGAATALSEHRITCLQIEWNECSSSLLGETREPIARLLSGWGYRLHRPDGVGRLVPVDDPSFGPDVFAVVDDRSPGRRP